MKLIKAIQDVLSPDLIQPHWTYRAHPLAGHCYHASEALYHLWGKSHGFVPAHVEVNMGRSWGWVGHWFLRKGKKILDPTADQFGSIRIPYSTAINCGFLTKEPSKRAQEIIRRLKRCHYAR